MPRCGAAHLPPRRCGGGLLASAMLAYERQNCCLDIGVGLGHKFAAYLSRFRTMSMSRSRMRAR